MGGVYMYIFPERKIKLQFLNVTQNLLTKFHIGKIGPFLLFNFLIWYKVITYTGNASWLMKLIGAVLDLVAWIYFKTFFGPSITY